MLLEIERTVDKYIKFFEVAMMADSVLVTKVTSTMKSKLRAERTSIRMKEQQTLIEATRKQKLDERMKREVVKGIKITTKRSEKPATKKKEAKKQDLTQEKLDELKYLGVLDHQEERKH